MSARRSSSERRAARARLITAQQGLCAWCGGYVREDVPEDHPHRAVLAHRRTPANGGARARDNQAAVCGGCMAKRRNHRRAR